MNNKTQLLISITITAIVMLFLGGVLGMTLQKTGGNQPAKNEAVNSLSSKVISSIVAYGQVKSIDGRTMVLTNSGDDLTISIADKASIYSFVVLATGKAPVQKAVDFETIKVGDNAQITIKVSPTGELQGSQVVIIPPASK